MTLSGGKGGAIFVQNIQQKCVGQAPHVSSPVLRSGQQLKQIDVNNFGQHLIYLFKHEVYFFNKKMVTNLLVKLYLTK